MTGIYSGLTNQQAFSIMAATMQVKNELPSLEESWNAGCYKARAVMVLTILSVLVLGGGALHLTLVATIGATALTVTLGGSIAWWVFHHTEERLEYLRELKIGLEQFRDAAEQHPGASAHELVAIMSHQTKETKL